MRRILSALAALMAATFCSAQQPASFMIEGTWANGSDGDTVYLVQQSQRQMVPVAQAILKDGKFVMEGKADGFEIRSVVGIHDAMIAATAQPVFVEGGAAIKMELPASPAMPARIYGEPNNEAWQELVAKELDFAQKTRPLYEAVQDTSLDLITRFQAKERRDSLEQAFSSVYVQQIVRSIPLPVSGVMLSEYQSALSDIQIDGILKAMEQKMPDNPYYQAIKGRRQALAETAPGQQFKDLALVDASGNMRRLSEVVKSNKLTLVDFWATWCRPCIAEIPNIKRIYSQYHGKGLEIYGVALDENQISWQNFIEKFELDWIQVSDLKGWQSAGAQSYSIQAIPATLLIDKSGKILYRDLRGQDLEARISEILK